MRNLLGASRKEFAALCQTVDVPTVHADGLFRALHKKHRFTLDLTDGLPKRLIDSLPSHFTQPAACTVQEHQSPYDKSRKLLIRLSDESQIESVLMPEARRLTLCVSTQVGCRQGCTFCHTGRMGLKRHLTGGEIVEQVSLANRWLAAHPDYLVSCGLPTYLRVTNLVFMGMGEPLDNVDAVYEALQILTDPFGPNIALRRISVSTAGHVEGLKQLVALEPKVRLALSLHTPFEDERRRLMPISRRWPLAEVLGEIVHLQAQGLAPVLIQYTLIAGVNDSVEHAQELLKILALVSCKINLIPLNEIEPSRFRAPSPESVEKFRDILYRGEQRVMVRYSKGQDIAAACGQLVV